MITKPKLIRGWKSLLKRLSLQSGSHTDRSNGLCAMEVAAYIASEPHSDHPACVCPVIGAFMRSWNDALPSDAERDRLLKSLIPLTVGTKASKVVENQRTFMCLDWSVRVFTPEWLALCDSERYKVHVEALKSLPEITDWDSLINATPILVNAQKEAAAARDAARDAAWDAARDAAWAAARDAAWAAAWDAAWDAARAAAKKKLKPVTERLQNSAADLVKRMCELNTSA